MPVEPISIIASSLTLVEKLQSLWPKIIVTVSSFAAFLCFENLFDGSLPDQIIKRVFVVIGVPESWSFAVDAVVSWLTDPVRAGYIEWGVTIFLIALYFLGSDSELKETVDKRGHQAEEVVPTRYGSASAYMFIVILLQMGCVSTVAWIVSLTALMCFWVIWRDHKRPRIRRHPFAAWAYGWLSGVISPPFMLISLFFSLLAVFAGKKRQ